MSLRAQSGCFDGTAVTSWQIKKLYKVPDFPSKRLPNWRTRGLEQRRQGLEAYIQVCMGFTLLPPSLLEQRCDPEGEVRGHGMKETHILSMLFTTPSLNFLNSNGSKQPFQY